MKMMRLLLLITGLFPFVAGAQPAGSPGVLTWGEELKKPGGTAITKIIDLNAEGFFALRQKEGGLGHDEAYVEYYDRNMQLRRSEKLDLKYKGKRRDFEDVIKIGGELYLFTSFNNPAHKKNYLFYQKLNRRLQPARDLVKIGEIDARNKEQGGTFNILLARDSSKVLLYNQLPSAKREPERFALQVFDQFLQPIWQRDITLPYSSQLFGVEDYRIDNQGNVYLLGVLYNDGVRERRRGSPSYQYVILAYTQGGSDIQEYRLSVGNKFLTDLTFRIADDGRLVCAGFYSDQGAYSIKGTCFFRLDPFTKAVQDLNLKAFDFEFRTEFMTEGEVRRAERAERSGNVRQQPELYRFSLDELVLRSDGGALLVAEQFFVFERVFQHWDGTMRFDYFYNYNDIIVVNIRPDGSIEWATRIPKRQETYNDGGYYSSYAMAIVRDRLYFVFNDNSRNFEGNVDNNRLHNYNGQNSVIALAELHRDGELRIHSLFRNKDANTITRPRICKQVGSRLMMVYGERGRNYRFGGLSFD
jgi:hypothetical protein